MTSEFADLADRRDAACRCDVERCRAAQAPELVEVAGQAYANIHDATYPGGEIEGQLATVPEPGTAALVLFRPRTGNRDCPEEEAQLIGPV